MFPRLAEFGEVEGIEVDPAAASEGPARSNKIQVGRFDRSFQPGRRYELILLLDVLEHLEDAGAALAYAVELLAESGLVLVTVPALNYLWTTHDDLNQHLRRYSKGSFERLACAAGLNVRDSRYFFHWLAATKLAVRAKERFVSTQPKPPAIPPPLVNRLLYRASRWEELLVRRLPVPFGNSLLVLGDRAGTRR
jgi:trans-aconitate methyltransferase